MAEATVSVTLERMAILLTANSGRNSGVEDQLSSLGDKLRQMQSFLKDADEKASENEFVYSFVSKVKSVAYDVEDLVEWYYVVRGNSSKGGILKRYASILKGCYFSSTIRLTIRILRSRISNLAQLPPMYGISATATGVEGASSSGQQISRRTYPNNEDEDVVGVKDGVDVLVGSLLSEDYRVVSICGMGGIGKTTLARKLFNHPDVRRYFAGFAWLYVSQYLENKGMLSALLTSLSPGTIDNVGDWAMDELALELRTLLKHKRCLIVLDDVWSEEAYDSMKAVFSTHTKVLLTTQMADVAYSIDPHAFVHQQQFLDEKHSWELFSSRVGTSFEGEEREDIERWQQQIVKFCGGLPLTLLVLGGILSSKPFIEWDDVLLDIKRFLVSENSYGGQSLSWILNISYNHLPFHLKQCFLYLGIFPLYTEIKAETLYQLWIAEGFVSMTDATLEDESIMDLAERYLDELRDRSMVILQVPDEPKMITKYKSCLLHDLLRDFCIMKAVEEAFFNLLGSNADIPSTSRFRRTVINFSHNQNVDDCLVNLGKETTRKLRMLRIVPDPDQQGQGSSVATTIGSMFDNIVILRVLSLEGLRLSGVWGLPKAIGKLLLLRYLSLKGSCFATLPASLSNLKQLQTLDLRVFKLCRLPDILWKMEGLLFLYLPSFYRLGRQLFKLRLDSLINLEILENFNDRICDPDDLFKLTKLRALFAECSMLENLEKISSYARSNKRLRHVSISTDYDFISNMDKELTILEQSFFRSHNIHCFRSEGAISRFPACETTSISSSLVQLTMNLFGLKGDHDVMGTLEKLISLRSLCLWRYEGSEMIFHADGFQQLTTLRLFSFLNMKKWVIEDKAVPNLSVLSIWGFPALEMIPRGLASITTLKELDIRNMPEKFKARTRRNDGGRDGDDFWKIKHIPSVLSS